MNTPDVHLHLVDTIDLPGPSTPDLYRAAVDTAELWREVACRLAAHITRINRAGDSAARVATVHPPTRRVSTPVDAWAAMRNSMIAAGVDIAHIERALGERMTGEGEALV